MTRTKHGKARKLAGRFVSTLLAACALVAVMGGQEAKAYNLSALDGAETVSDAELSEMRGEFIGISGLKIGFGAEVRTFADGVLLLSTQFVWTPQGIIATTNASDLASRIDATVASQLSALGVHGVTGGEGYAVMSETGAAAVIHRADQDGIQNFLINSQSNTAFHQEMTLNFELPGFDVMQSNMDVDRIGLQLRDDIMAASMTWR